MESNIKASFIPDNMPSASPNGAPVTPGDAGGGSAADILILIAVVALAASLALAAGVFLYDRFLDANVQKKSEQLERARQAFEPGLIEELVRLDSRLAAADDVLTRHVAPSELFNLLEELTLQSVSYETMDYTVQEDESIKLRIKGKARSVNGVALQASVFGQHNAISNPIFSNLDLVSDGVKFEVTALVNPTAIQYSTVFSQYSNGVETFGEGFDEGEFDDAFETVPEGNDSFDDTPASGTDDEFGDFGVSSEAENVTQ